VLNGPCLKAHRGKKKGGEQESANAHYPPADFGFGLPMLKAVGLHGPSLFTKVLSLCPRMNTLQDKELGGTTMEPTLPPRIGLRTGIQAGGFIGLFLGFSLAVLSALTQPENLIQLVQLMCVTPLGTALVLGPFLAWRRAPAMPTEDPLAEVREVLAEFNEGQGRWRVLSHVRSDGRTVRLDLHNSSQPLAMVAATLPLTQRFPIRYIVGRGEARSRDPALRSKVLNHIEQHVELHRRRRTSSAVEVLPTSILEHMEATHRMHRRLFYLLPIILFFAWLELR
jgi:hypothetical protein